MQRQGDLHFVSLLAITIFVICPFVQVRFPWHTCEERALRPISNGWCLWFLSFVFSIQVCFPKTQVRELHYLAVVRWLAVIFTIFLLRAKRAFPKKDCNEWLIWLSSIVSWLLFRVGLLLCPIVFSKTYVQGGIVLVMVKWLMVTISVIFPHRPSVSVFCQNARASEFETFGKPHYCSYLNLPWVLESFCCDDWATVQTFVCPSARPCAYPTAE